MDFKNKSRKFFILWCNHCTILQLTGLWFRTQFQEFFQKRLYTEVSHSTTKEHRGKFAIIYLFHIEFIASHIQQFDIVAQVFIQLITQHFLNLRVIQGTGSRFKFLSTVATIFFKELNAIFQTVINAFIMTVDTDRPVNGICSNVQYFFQLVHQIKGIASITVQFVYKSKDGQLTTMANPEQLFSLRFYTFRCVDKHYCAICCHQSTIGIFREVLVTRGIKNINAITIVIKLQNRRCNGNTTLLFDFHPVGNSVLIAFSCFNGASQVNCSAV